MKTHITLEISGQTGRILLSVDPPGKPPTLDYESLQMLEDAIDKAAAAVPDIRVLYIESREPKYFLVGANLKALQEIDHESIRPWVNRGHHIFNKLQTLEIPVVALVRGIAAGGGLELALACDFIYADINARFAMPEAGLGLIPGWGGTFRVPLRTGAPFAKELLFSGRTISAETAFDRGLINYYGTGDELAAHIRKFSEEVTANSPVSISMIKQCINAATAPREIEMQFAEAASSSAVMASGNTQKRLADFFASRGTNADSKRGKQQ